MKKALEGLPGAPKVYFDERMDTFLVEGATVSPDEVRIVVLKTVVFPWLRGILGRLGGRLRR